MSSDSTNSSAFPDKHRSSQWWYVYGFLSITMAWTLWLPNKPVLFYRPETVSQYMAALLLGLGGFFVAVGFIKNRHQLARGWFVQMLLITSLVLFPWLLAREALNLSGKLAPLLLAVVLTVGGWFFIKIKLKRGKRKAEQDETEQDETEQVETEQVETKKSAE